jgi:hypothetical protein
MNLLATLSAVLKWFAGIMARIVVTSISSIISQKGEVHKTELFRGRMANLRDQ